MITVAQAKKLRHGQTIWLKDAWDSNGTAAHCRVSGKVQLWKTRPNDFKVPVKRGLYDNGYITPDNAVRFSLIQPSSKKPTKVIGKRPFVPRTPRPYYPQYGIR